MPTDDVTDRHLVSKFLRTRDEASFRSLHRLHSPMLYRVALRLLARPELAEDVLQETWIRAVRLLPRFRWESQLRTWLAGIAIRCCHEVRRTATAVDSEAAPWPARATAGDGLRLDLERAVATLAPGRREILLLHDVEGFTHAEIATMLDIDEGTSKSQLSRARQQMRRLLDTGTDGQRPTEMETDDRE